MIARRAALVVPLVTSLLGCAAPPPRPAPAPATPADEWVYEIHATESARELEVRASFPSGSDPELSVDDGAEPFVRDVTLVGPAEPETIAPTQLEWRIPSCRTAGCEIRYRFLLADAAAALRDPDIALDHHGMLVAPPSTWLLRPLSMGAARGFRFRVSLADGVGFASGVFPDRGPQAYKATIGDLPGAPFSAFGRFEQKELRAGGGTLEIAVAPGRFAIGEEAVLDWIRKSADVVASYYGAFPVARVLLLVLPADGRGLGYGKTLGNGGASILLPVGRSTPRRELDDDWMLVHEMLHLAFPSLPRQHLWLEEGIATYIEPFARARAGRLSVEEAWRGLVRGLPNGLPQKGDEGLDNTHTWGRTYWGGALFCFLADVAIRERTHNQRSIDDALRAILSEGGNVSRRWELDRALDTGDRAVGSSILRDLHQKMGPAPFSVDLAALMQKLGVRLHQDRVVFDDAAPLSDVRRAMTAREPTAPNGALR